MNKWIQGMGMKKGALHRSLGVPMDEPIPAEKLAAAKHSTNPTIRRRANLAATLKAMQRGRKG